MERRWEKGVVIGQTANQKTFFVGSSHDAVIMPNSLPDLQLGDCIEFTTRSYLKNDRSTKILCERAVLEYRKCEPFVQSEQERGKRSVYLICDITGVSTKFVPEVGKTVRALRTSFLNDVVDISNFQPTLHVSDEDLLRMQVVCKRFVGTVERVEMWVVHSIRPKKDTEIANAQDFATNIGSRLVLKGFIPTEGINNNGPDDLFIWVPHRHRDFTFRSEYRRGLGRQVFIGRWVTFSVSPTNSFQIDEDSNVRIIDNCLPTKSERDLYHIRVPCKFNAKCDNKGFPLLESKHCGPVVDIHRTLERYNKNNSNFSGECWVFYFLDHDDREIKFALSRIQDEWTTNEENITQHHMDKRDLQSNQRVQSQNEYRPRQQFHNVENAYEDDDLSSSYGRLSPTYDNSERNRSHFAPRVPKRGGRRDQEPTIYDDRSVDGYHRNTNTISTTSYDSGRHSDGARYKLSENMAKRADEPERYRRDRDYVSDRGSEQDDVRAVRDDFRSLMRKNTGEYSNRSSEFDESASTSSSSKRGPTREKVLIELESEDNENYKNFQLVKMFRKMMTNRDVRESMERYDKEIYQRIMDTMLNL